LRFAKPPHFVTTTKETPQMPTQKARGDAWADTRVSGFASREEFHSALRGVHLKHGELQELFRCSRGIADKLAARPDFPRPISLTEDGLNLRYVYDEVIRYRDTHRREINGLLRARRRVSAKSAEDAVRAGLAALRAARQSGNFR
jgi:hypothetical protein